jgi:hypothetical protein
MNTKQQQPVIENDPWREGANLDRRDCTFSVEELESGFLDPEFAPLDSSGQGAGSRALKAFIEEQKAASDGPSVLHVGNDEFEITVAEGTWHANATVGKNTVAFTAGTRDELVTKLMEFAKQRSAPRDLSPGERLRVARLAQSGDKDGAINFYLLKALGSARVHSYRGNELKMASDPELQDVLDECAYVTWIYSRPDVSESDEWLSWLPRYTNGRPLVHTLLDAAWSAFTERNFRSTLLPKAKDETDPRKIVRELNELSDADVERTYAETIRHVATARR